MEKLSPAAVGDVDRIRETFLHARPFRHVAVDDFFDPAFAERLLEEFPSFDKRLAHAESGETGGKSVNTAIATISPAYEELYSFISSAPFLEYMSRLSGIDGLIHDPAMYGGGTHENLHGQELDPHVDFNFDQSQKLHRRLNLIVYLNKDWKPEWGGGLEIHSNPRDPAVNRIQTFGPLFNRAVLFETNEYSWHGFPKIQLPEDRRNLSRKSISVYLYTEDRPAEEIAPKHATFYVQRPLPPSLGAGHTLTEEDVLEIHRLLARRDRWIEYYQRMELDKNRHIDSLSRHIVYLEKNMRLPLTGYICQEGAVTGFYCDLWSSSHLQARLLPQTAVRELVMTGYRPDGSLPATITMLVNGKEAARGQYAGGRFELKARPPRKLAEPFDFEILFDAPAAAALPGGDIRDLAFMLIELRAAH